MARNHFSPSVRRMSMDNAGTNANGSQSTLPIQSPTCAFLVCREAREGFLSESKAAMLLCAPQAWIQGFWQHWRRHRE